MALETGTHISDLVATNPAGTDAKSTLDDHIKLIKSTLLATFPNITGAMTKTHALLNQLGTTATAGTSDVNPASHAFVQQEIASVNAQTALTVTITSTANPTLVAGSINDLTYTAAANAPKLPASASSGDELYLRFSNSYYTNEVDRNGLTILGSASNLTGCPPNIFIGFKYINGSWGVL